MSASADWVVDRLEATSQWWWLFSFLCRTVTAIAASLVLLLAIVWLDAVLQLSAIGLAIGLGFWIVCSAGLALGLIWWTVNGQRSVEATARRVEMAFPELGNDLINAVQLSRSPDLAASPFSRAFVNTAVARARRISFRAAASRMSRWQRLRYGLQTPRDLLESLTALLAVLAVLVACATFVPRWSSAARRLFQPWSQLPLVGYVQIVEVTPGDTRILAGTDLEITAAIENPGRKRHDGVLWVKRGDDRPVRHPLTVDSSGEHFAIRLPSVMSPFRYQIEIGDSQSSWFNVDIVQKPVVESVEVRYEFPAYLERDPESVKQQHGDLNAPQFSVAKLQIRSSKEIASGHVMIDGRKELGRVGSDRRSLMVRLFLDREATYTIHLFDADGHTDEAPRVNHIRVTVDQPPSIQMARPAGPSSIAPDGGLDFVLTARDDYGLAAIRLERKAVDTESDEPIRIVQQWKEFVDRREAKLAETIPAQMLGISPGQAVMVRAVAQDARRVHATGRTFGPQEAATPWRRVSCVSAENLAKQELATLDRLQAELWKMLQTQLEARRLSATIDNESALDVVRKTAGTVLQMQVALQRKAREFTDSLQPQSDTQRKIRIAIGNLANGALLEAVRQSDALVNATALPALAEPLAALKGEQDHVIKVLRLLLDSTRLASAEALAQMADRPGGDLPPEAQEKLRELKEKLDEFLKAQRKVIEATKDLAKTPVDDFTEEEEQLLKDLAAAEDKWSRFLEDAHSDLSKLPEQDFANPSLLQELVEIQTEIKMAEGALTKKTADIAVPLEQLGAERAEELVSNIEKWLPDTPDRERWSQEEPLTDEMKEAPMAELPGELEDLVGELMEEEEDLFDEMEDASSSWADSLDKGAGWDAADGPISNMSAKGVTGNRLPNNSEIGGRSGEGRQGKSSGEFVSDTAVGKGGRRTPSRLTPDPQVKGQVKDYSKDPVGGATGGGKESGQGGEGLEGPVPPARQREMQRLANAQASLRNKAEAIDLKFQVMNYHHTDLKKLIEQMKAVEADLAAGRYQSALRRRTVLLDALKSLKLYAGGEFQVRRDESMNVPREIQKELVGSMHEPSPEGWEELNRAYFEKLSTGQVSSSEKQSPSSSEGK